MKRQFVTYEIALALKELGFDEPCLARFTAQKDLVTSGCYTDSDPIMLGVCNSDIHESNVAAPLWQQVIDWFELKHGIIIVEIPIYINVAIGDCKLDSWENNLQKHEEYFTRYKAREAAVLEAIQTFKNAKK